jgi:uncharacterized repeat protein (TIGR02543 family)
MKIKNLFKKKHYITSIALIIAATPVSIVEYSYYKIEVDLNGGILENSNIFAVFTPKVFLDVTPTKEGFDFLGWYVNYQTRLEDYNHILRNDIVLVAEWEVSEFTATFQTNGGSSVSPRTVLYNQNLRLPSTTRSGFTFLGWSLSNEGGGTLYAGNSIFNNVKEDLTFYAYWAVIRSVTITLDARGGSVSPSTLTGNSGSSLSLPTPSRSGYRFDGWYTSTSFDSNSQFIRTTYPDTNTTLYAKWSVQANDGSSFALANNMLVNATYTVNISIGGQLVYYKFIPTISRSYTFSSSGSLDTYGSLFSSTYAILQSDDDTGTGLNFSFSRSLVRDTTYYLRVKLVSTTLTGYFTIQVQ